MSNLTDELNALKRAERHNTVAESRYWCDQYRQFAERAVQAAMEGQEPVAWCWLYNGAADGSVFFGKGPDDDIAIRAAGVGVTVRYFYTTPPNMPVLERDRADAYEELRAIIDGGSESMTHADAVEWCKRHAEADWKPVKNNS